MLQPAMTMRSGALFPPAAAPSAGPASGPALPWPRAERLLREHGNRESRRFQAALADQAIRRFGIASAMAAAGVHRHAARVLAGGSAGPLLEGIQAEMRRDRITLGAAPVDRLQIEACLCSPVMGLLVLRRLADACTRQPAAGAPAAGG